jgi:outer membrane lipoprotein-sorting protein
MLLCALTAPAQEFVTPADYFDRVSQSFGAIQDYTAIVTIDQNDGELVMKGNLMYKNPNKLRIDFQEPREQVLAMDGEKLTIYIPRYSYILEQQLKRRSEATVALMASNQELSYLEENYSVAYLVGPDPVPLEEGSAEMVVKLKFQSRSSVEGFRQLEISFREDGMIRRVIGRMPGKTLTMDFTNIQIDPGIPEERFEYESPVHANVYKDFLFEGME